MNRRAVDRSTARAPAPPRPPDRELPPLDTLTPDQVRGGTCVWCAGPLSPGKDVDLGCRQDPRVAYSAAWFPRACRACALSHGEAGSTGSAAERT